MSVKVLPGTDGFNEADRKKGNIATVQPSMFREVFTRLWRVKPEGSSTPDVQSTFGVHVSLFSC